MEEALRMAKQGKPLMAMTMIKSYVQDNVEGKDIRKMNKECRDLIYAILSTPSLNDESWGVFVPAPTEKEIEIVIEKIRDCLSLF
uniref:Uncharacterized protein n=2 Tax=Acidianus brierleyi TaxID=41673 RepID=A0A2U9IB96_9CREN